MTTKMTVIILTFNEEKHIDRAIKNVREFCNNILIIDSYSTDNTVNIAKKNGVEVIFRKFDNYKNQREYAINLVKNKTEWMLFLDADEYLTSELMLEINHATLNNEINGYYIPRRFIFMGRWIKWGGYYPTYLLRLFRPECASINREINEHIIVSGKSKKLTHDFVDHNLNGIGHWVDKHNRYATQEAIDLFKARHDKHITNTQFSFRQDLLKNWVRVKLWNKIPVIYIRPVLYYIYRYFIRLGFLDGKSGFIYHFLQAYWFWMLVDLKYFELKSITHHFETSEDVKAIDTFN